jgi:hypothetical protein
VGDGDGVNSKDDDGFDGLSCSGSTLPDMDNLRSCKLEPLSASKEALTSQEVISKGEQWTNRIANEPNLPYCVCTRPKGSRNIEIPPRDSASGVAHIAYLAHSAAGGTPTMPPRGVLKKSRFWQNPYLFFGKFLWCCKPVWAHTKVWPKKKPSALGQSQSPLGQS